MNAKDEAFRRSFEPRAGLRRVFARFVTLATYEDTFMLKPGEIIWVLGPPERKSDAPHSTPCSRALTKFGVGLVANTALYDYTVRL